MSHRPAIGIKTYFQHLYERFNKDPDAFPVLRIEDRSDKYGFFNSGHLHIENFQFLIVPGATEIADNSAPNGKRIVQSPAQRVEINLLDPSEVQSPHLSHGVTVTPTITIGEVYTKLNNAGYRVSQVEPRFFGIAATILAERHENLDGRTYLTVATSVLWRIFMPIAQEGNFNQEQTEDALRQLDLRLAEGIWLDRIGELYGLARYEDESDKIFRRRIDFHVAHPHTNNVTLEYMIDRLFAVKSEVVDTLVGEFFLTNDPYSVTYGKGLRDIKRTTHGDVPMFTVYLDKTFPMEKETPQKKFDRELQKNHWFYTDDPNSVTADNSEDSHANTTTPGQKFLDTAIDNRELLLVYSEEERSIYRSIANYKAAGSRFIVREKRTLRTLDDSHYSASPLFLPKTIFIRGTDLPDTVSEEESFINIFEADDSSRLREPNSFASYTSLKSSPNISGIDYNIEKILANR